MQPPTPQPQHEWLARLVGEWTFEMDAEPPPGEAPGTHAGVERVRRLGDVWVLCEGEGRLPDGGATRSLMTLGFDPARDRFVGTFVASMMTHLWQYEGSLDADGRALTLDTEGPSFDDSGRTARYRDVIALDGDAYRTLTSYHLGDDGAWQAFMTAHYRRTG